MSSSNQTSAAVGAAAGAAETGAPAPTPPREPETERAAFPPGARTQPAASRPDSASESEAVGCTGGVVFPSVASSGRSLPGLTPAESAAAAACPRRRQSLLYMSAPT